MKIEGEKNPNKQTAAEYRRISSHRDLETHSVMESRDKEVRTRIRYLVREDEPVSPS